MPGNQGSDAERGQQKAYEARTAPIQQHIKHLLEEHSRLTVLAQQHRPSAQDDVARLIHLHATLRPLTQQIRNYIVDYLRADTEWSGIIAEFKLHVNRDAWAQAMLQQRNVFYHGLSLASTPLDYLFARLLQDVQRTLEDIETFIQADSNHNVPAVPAPQNHQRGPDPAHSVGPSAPPRDTMASDAAHSVARADSNPNRSHTAATSQNRTSGIRPAPANQHHRTDQPHGGPTSASNVRTFVNSSRRRNGTTGIMTVTDGNVANAIPLAWNAAHDSEFGNGPAQLYASAPPPAYAGHTAHSVGPCAAEPIHPSEPPRPQRPVDTERQRQLQQSLNNTVAGGKWPSQATSSSPLKFGADGRPFACSTTDASSAPCNRAADFGEDFARENSSMFYRNAKFTRPAQSNTSQPSLLLREFPLTPFDGEIRSYQQFRNRFLEIVEAQRNLEPRHKLLYLLQQLRGEPLRMSDGFPIADESYFNVIDLLEQKYGDMATLKNLLTQDIINLQSPKMKREELQDFHDKAFRTICKLRQLGPGCGPDSILVQILLGKLPNAMKLKLFENRDYAAIDANAVLKVVRDHLSIVDRVNSYGLTFHQGTQEKPTTSWSNPPGSFNQQNRTRTNKRHDSRPAPNNTQFYVAVFSINSCSFCNEGHAANDCTTYATADDRFQRASELNLCLLCLEEGHGRWMCPRRPWLLRLRELLFGVHTGYHEALHRNVVPPSLPVRAPSPLATGGVDGLFSTGVADHGLPESANFLTNGVLDVISPPIETVPHAWEQPAVLGVCSAKCEAFNGNSASETTASPERTAPCQEGTSRPTTSSGARSQNPQGATACGDEESLFTHRQYLSADNDSRTRTTQDASKTGSRTKLTGGTWTPTGGCDSRSKEEVLIHKSSEETTCRASEPPASTSNRFNDVDYTAQPTPNSPSAVLLECVEALASAPDGGSTTRRLLQSDDLPTIERNAGHYRDVIVFFDSGCSQTCVSRRLTESLRLPLRRQRTLHVNSFGSRPPVVMEGIDTTITLWTTDYRPITFDATSFHSFLSIPLAWNAAHDSEFGNGPAQLYASAPPPAYAGHTAHSVGPCAAEPIHPSEPPRPQRPVDTERQRQLQQSLNNTVAGGKWPSQATSSSPLKFGADGRPFACSTTDASSAPCNRAADFGEDFARENSSMFYRNAKFTRPAQSNTSQPSLLLREFPLTPFDGEIRSYQEFRNRFLEIVEAQRNLEPRHKLLYLLQQLRGEPLRMSDGFPIADESYFNVIDLLEQKYGDMATLKNLLTQDIINLQSPKMKREELQDFHDKAFRTICKLRQLGPGCGPDSILVQILLGKLPNAMKLKLFENRDYAAIDANAVLKVVRDHLSIVDRVNSYGLTFHQGTQEKPTTSWSNPPGSFNQQNRTRTNKRHDSRPAPNNTQFYVAVFSINSCSFCNEGHAANDCTTYATADDRFQRASELNLCLLCLEEGHGRWMCPRRPWLLRLRELLFGVHTGYHEALHRNVVPPSLPVRAPSPLATGGVDGLFSTGVADHGLPESANFLTNGVLDVISPPIETVPHAWEQPAVLGVCSAKCEAFNGNSASETTASPERTAPCQEGTSRPTTSSGARSQNPQGATACGDEESLFTHRQYLSADNDSRTRTTQDASKTGSRTKLTGGTWTPTGGCDSRSKEEVLIHKSSEETTCRASEPPASTSNRFNDVDYTAQPTPNSPSAVLLECVEALASAPDGGSTTRRLLQSDDLPTIERNAGHYRDVIVFFDSGCSQTCVSRRLTESLRLPLRRQRTLHVNSFGSRPPVVMEGIDTTITLWTTDYRPITFDAIALETVAPQVTSALVEKTDLPLLNLGFPTIRPLRLQPDVVIGQDLVHLFDRQVLPSLPHGFYVVGTNIGTTLGGAGQLYAARGDTSASPRRVPHSARLSCLRQRPEEPSFDQTVETHHYQENPVPTESGTLCRPQS